MVDPLLISIKIKLIGRLLGISAPHGVVITVMPLLQNRAQNGSCSQAQNSPEGSFPSIYSHSLKSHLRHGGMEEP